MSNWAENQGQPFSSDFDPFLKGRSKTLGWVNGEQPERYAWREGYGERTPGTEKDHEQEPVTCRTGEEKLALDCS